MPQEIKSEIAKEKYGVTTQHEEMDNGERRFRLKKNDGSSYIRTEAGSKGAWQNSHYHKHSQEIYVVQEGWIALATKPANSLEIRKYCVGEMFTTIPGMHHNIYMPAKAVIHTIKYGTVEKDWISDEGLDKLTKGLSEEQIKLEAEKSNKD